MLADAEAAARVEPRGDRARDRAAASIKVEEAALGIHRILNAQVAEGIRLVSIRQGHDPRRFTLLPLGGGGALHVCPLAEELGINRILVPRLPGVLSAAGLLAAPVEHEVSTALPRAIDVLDLGEVRTVLDQLDARCSALMAREVVGSDGVVRRYFADVCYVGQAYHLEVPFEPAGPDPLGALTAGFYAIHDRSYGYAPKSPVRLVNLRTVHSAAGVQHLHEDWVPEAKAALVRKAHILLPELKTSVEAAVYDRAGLKAGEVFNGPAIVEQDDTTTLVLPNWHARIDALGNMILER